LHDEIISVQEKLENVPETISLPIKQLLKHVSILINYSQSLSQLNAHLLENQIIEQTVGLASRYNDEFQISTQHAAEVKKWFYLSIVILIFSVIWIWHKQQVTLSKLNIHAQRLQRATRVFSETHEGITMTDKDGTIIDVNPAFCQITGYSREDVIGQNPSILSSGKQSLEYYNEMWDKLIKDGHWQGEIWNRKKTGELYAQLQTISSIVDDSGKTVNYIGLFSDITRTKKQQEKLNLMAHYDVLTNLPNRALFIDRFHQAIAHSNRTKTQLAVCFLDLDNFKPVNDNYGHEVGDKLLIEVAERIKSCIREEDTVSRQGGDEFALLLNDIESFSHFEQTMERIHYVLAQPFLIDGHAHIVTASSGITLYPTDDGDIDTLLRHADQAMYKAKQVGRNRYELFDTTQDQETFDRHQHLNQIIQALENNEFRLYYQPKVNMITGVVFGAEALIRWHHPKKGIIQPLNFLPLIYGSEVEIKIGNWVIEQALKQLDHWNKQGLNIEVSINIAAYQLQSDRFFERLETALARYPAVNSKSLQLEILESGELSDLQSISTIIETSQSALGVNMALDDFGTGYSSLTHLRNLPAKTLKIDQSFVRNMLDDPSDYAIIDGVIGLAESFHRDVIAEGVESTQHGLMLLLLGCEQAQGYGIARPMPAEDFPNWFYNYKPSEEWQNFGKNNLTDLEQKVMLLQLTLERWHDLFLTSICSEPDEVKHWPILNENHCHCGLWLKRTKLDHSLPEYKIESLNELHDEMHALTNEMYRGYQAGRLEEVRKKLVRVDLIYTRIKDELLHLA